MFKSSKKTVLIVTKKPFSEDARDAAADILKEAGLTVKFLEEYKSQQELIDASKGVYAIIVRGDEINKRVIDAFPDSLELIVRAGTGINALDTDYAKQKNIVVENTPGQNSNAVAELTLEMMLGSIRPLNGKTGRELKGKELGVHGFGYIGQLVAELGKAFGMEVSAYDILLNEGTPGYSSKLVKKAKKLGVTIANSPKELYKGKDIVSLHIPLNPKTFGSINYDLLKLMSDRGILVNTARAGIIYDHGLLKILEERPEFKYVTDDKPTDKTKAIMYKKFKDQTKFTPKKQGAQTEESNFDTATYAAKLCRDYFRKGLTPHVVN